MPRSRSALLLLLLLMLSGGCEGNDDGPTTPDFPRATVKPEDLRATDDQAGMLACGALSASLKDGTLMAPGVAESIVTSASSADGPIADAARRLQAAYASAVASKDTAEEPDAVAGVNVAGSNMLNVCDQSGLKTAG